jgi:lysine decarboxylase
MEESFREYVTTSPSYHLLASADAAVRSLAADGREALGACIARTRALKAGLRERLPRLVHMDDPAWTGRRWSHVAGTDLVKTTVALSGYDLSGFAVSDALVERGIVVEKAGINTLTFITTFQLEAAAVEDTVVALEEILAPHELPDGDLRPLATNPFSAIADRPVMHPYHARRYAKSIGQEVPIEQAIGRVAAEIVEVYPPGIPVILEGFRVSADAVRYLCEVRDMGGAIVARDTSLRTLRVL